VDAQVTDSWIGRTLGGRYKILESIGEGGMGIVYRAKQMSVDREVAIKMMHTRAAHDPQWSERFQSEAKACSLLTHPNTIRLYDFGKTTLGNFYMVMELLTGQTLTDVVQEQAPIAPARVLRILMQCCASLSEAHKAGIIHRDLKPDNIFVQKLEGADDFIKLIDFSIAKRSDVAMTAAGVVMGTPQFMSPEQGRGKDVDHRSDLYSLGIVAYLMLCGRLPFHDEDPLEVLRMHQTMEPPPMDDFVPSSVQKLVSSCLDKNAARRPASALALLEACKIWLTEIDPTLDVASDPILKNTLVGGGATVDHDSPTRAQPRHSANVKTMLGASGAIGASWSTAMPTASPAQQDASDSGQTLVEAPAPLKKVSDSSQTMVESPSISESQQTLIHGGGQGMAAAAAVAESEVSDSARTLIQDGGSGQAQTTETDRTKRTSIQSPSGTQRSHSEEMRRQDGQERRRTPTNRPTVNDFSVSTSPPPADRVVAAAPMKATTVSASPAGAPMAASAAPMKATTVSASPAGAPMASSAAPMKATTVSASPAGAPMAAPAPRMQRTTVSASPSGAPMVAAPAGAPVAAASYGEPLGALPVRGGRGGFLFACLLVALTFGFGAYFLTSTLR
jgi:serine/threonine-protein kinase